MWPLFQFVSGYTLPPTISAQEEDTEEDQREAILLFNILIAYRSLFSAVDVSRVLHSVAKLSSKDPLFKPFPGSSSCAALEAVLAHARSEGYMATMTGTQVAQMLWAFGRMRFFRAEAMDPITERLVDDAFRESLNAWDVSNIAWGLAQLQVRDEAVLEAVAQAAARLAPGLTTQGIGNTAWAFATLGTEHLELMEALASQVC